LAQARTCHWEYFLSKLEEMDPRFVDAGRPAPAVGGAAEQKQQELSAKKLFKYVSGVLNGAFPSSCVDRCVDDINVWVKTGQKPSFELACDALTEAIKANLVPQQGIDVLKSLATESEQQMQFGIVPKILQELLMTRVDNADYETNVGSDAVDECMSVCDEQPDGIQEQILLCVSDYADLRRLKPAFLLRKMLLGPSGENLTFIHDETGINLSLEERDKEVYVCLRARESTAVDQNLQQAAFLAKDLISRVTTELHDVWVKTSWKADQPWIKSQTPQAKAKESNTDQGEETHKAADEVEGNQQESDEKPRMLKGQAEGQRGLQEAEEEEQRCKKAEEVQKKDKSVEAEEQRTLKQVADTEAAEDIAMRQRLQKQSPENRIFIRHKMHEWCQATCCGRGGYA